VIRYFDIIETNGNHIACDIDEDKKTISLALPYGWDITHLETFIEVSWKASVSPNSGSVQNFTHPVVYTVTAEDGSKVTYTVTITVAPNSEAKITGFNLNAPETQGVIDEKDKIITVTIPYGTSKTNLTPVITLSSGATVSPESGVAQNFTNSVQYTVTAEDKNTKANYFIQVHAPFPVEITGVDKTTVDGQLGKLTITGHFGPSGNTVRLWWKNGESKYVASFTPYPENATTLTITLLNVAPGSYSLTVLYSEGEATWTTPITVVRN
jgi:hypothetical protein